MAIVIYPLIWPLTRITLQPPTGSAPGDLFVQHPPAPHRAGVPHAASGAQPGGLSQWMAGEVSGSEPAWRAPAIAPLRGYAPARGLACAPPRSGATNPRDHTSERHPTP